MNVELDLKTLPAQPAPHGPHGLAWSYVLDTVFADAAHAGVDTLHLTLPHADLAEEVTLRGSLTSFAGIDAQRTSTQRSVGTKLEPNTRTTKTKKEVRVARFGTLTPDTSKDETEETIVRLYTLSYGRLAPRSLRKLNTKPTKDWCCTRTLFVFTWRARALGLPMRFFNLRNAPHRADRAMFAMRRVFASATKTPAFYRLECWERTP